MMKMGYVILYQSIDTTTHKIIQRNQLKAGFDIEDACYIHSEVSFGGQHSVAVHPPRIELVDILETCAGRYIKVLKYKNKDYGNRTRYKISGWALSTCNMKYDKLGILAFKFPILYKIPFIKDRIKTLFFCSDNVLWSFRKEHPDVMNGLDTNRCMPAHFSASEEFETVFEGRIPQTRRSSFEFGKFENISKSICSPA